MRSINPAYNSESAIGEAVALRGAGRGEQAVAVLRSAIAHDPRNARLWQTLGTVHRAMEQSAAAIAAFEEAAKLTSGDMRALHGYAQASLEAGRSATVFFEGLHARTPSDGSVLLGLAAAQLAEGHADAAIAMLDKIVASSPLWLDGQATLARLRWMNGDADEVDLGYRQAVQAHPAHVGLWTALIDLLIHVEQFDAARRTVGAARAAIGEHPMLRTYDAQCASEMGDRATADNAFAHLADADDIGIVEQHARHLLRCGRPEAAAARIEPLLGDRQADRLWPYVSLAWRMIGDPRSEWLEGDPALVGCYDLGLSALDITGLADRLRALHVAKRDPLGQSVRGGTQTDGPLFAHEAPEIRRLRAAVVDAVDRHIAAMGAVDPRHPTRRHIGKPFRFAGSWSVRLTGAGHHSSHIHPQGWLSSACYIALPSRDEMGPEPAGWLHLGQPPASLGLDLHPYRRIAPAPGRLVLFPSTMWHGTAPIEGGERLTVAFDVAAIE